MLLIELFRFLKLVSYLRLMLHLAYYSINDWIFLVVFGKLWKFFRIGLLIIKHFWKGTPWQITAFFYNKLISYQLISLYFSKVGILCSIAEKKSWKPWKSIIKSRLWMHRHLWSPPRRKNSPHQRILQGQACHLLLSAEFFRRGKSRSSVQGDLFIPKSYRNKCPCFP